MVDFTLTDEQKNLRELAHDFAVKEIRPVAWEYDKDGTWPEDIIKKAWDVGLMNTHIPEEYGSPGASYLDGCVIEEELSWGCSGIQTSLGCNGLATAPIWSYRLSCPRVTSSSRQMTTEKATVPKTTSPNPLPVVAVGRIACALCTTMIVADRTRLRYPPRQG